MKTLKEKVIKSVRDERKKIGFDGKTEVKEKYMQSGSFKMHTNMKDKNTLIQYDPRYAENKSEAKLIESTSDGMAHEGYHHIKCPQTVEKDTDLFFEPMYEILDEKGFNKQDIHYATNALQDSILHDAGKHEEKRDWNGIVNFFENQGEFAENKKLTGFYEAHVKMNMDLWGAKKQRKTLSKFYTNKKNVKESLDGFYGELNNGKFKSINESYIRSKKDKNGNWIDRKNIQTQSFDKTGIQQYLLDEENWSEVSAVYAKHMSKLMIPGYAMPTTDNSGAGTKGREEEDSSDEGTPFQKERESRNFKKSRVMKANKKGEEAPPWIDKMEVLDIVYEAMVDQIQIKAESYRNPESFPVAWYANREFNEEKDNFRNTSFGINDKGELELRKKQYSIDIPIEVKTSPKSFPKIKFGMIDVSASMLSGISGDSGSESIIPWGDNSKYHWALMTQFGIFEYFKRNHLLSQNSISAATFGESTKVVEGYRKTKEYLLSPSFECSTNIDIKQVKKFFEGRGNLIYTCSDGQINNWDNIEDEFIREAKRHSYIHFQFGRNTNMTKSLKDNGLEVIIAEDGKGVVRDVIDLTDKIIREN